MMPSSLIASPAIQKLLFLSMDSVVPHVVNIVSVMPGYLKLSQMQRGLGLTSVPNFDPLHIKEMFSRVGIDMFSGIDLSSMGAGIGDASTIIDVASMGEGFKQILTARHCHTIRTWEPIDVIRSVSTQMRLKEKYYNPARQLPSPPGMELFYGNRDPYTINGGLKMDIYGNKLIIDAIGKMTEKQWGPIVSGNGLVAAALLRLGHILDVVDSIQFDTGFDNKKAFMGYKNQGYTDIDAMKNTPTGRTIVRLGFSNIATECISAEGSYRGTFIRVL